MAYVTPRTWVAGAVLTAAQLNQDIRDNVTFLANPPACRVYHNAAQSIANAAETPVAFNSERFDTDSMHDTATNNTRITFNTAGIYVVTFSGQWASDVDGIRQATIKLNGATHLAFDVRPALSGTYGFHVSTVYKFAAASYVEATVFHVAGAALNLNSGADYTPEFSAVWVGLG